MLPVIRMMVQGIFAQIDPCEEVVVVGKEQGLTGEPQREHKKHLGMRDRTERGEVRDPYRSMLIGCLFKGC